MANDKKFVESITDMEKDFPQWYTDVVKKADLVDYSSVKGCMIIRPYGYAIWELIQKHPLTVDVPFSYYGAPVRVTVYINGKVYQEIVMYE